MSTTAAFRPRRLIASARAAHVARRAGEYGVMIDGPIAVDMKQVKARKDAVVRRSSEGLEQWLKDTENLTVYEGHARFDAAHQVQCWRRHLLEAEKIFINVEGTQPYRPCRVSIRCAFSPTRP